MSSRIRNSLHNIKQIIVDDFHAYNDNVIAIVIIVGLVFIPSLYAWFNISASWDPYKNTGNLKIAVANTDEGYVGDLSTIEVNFGERLTSEVRANNKFKWVVVDEDEALDGVKSGEYYAAIIVPESFSRDMMSLFSTDIKHSKIIYYSNEKENAIAGKVTVKGADAIQQSINETFNKILMQVAMDILDDLTEDEGDLINLETARGIINSMDKICVQLETLQTSCETIGAALDTIEGNFETSASIGEAMEDFTTNAQSALQNVDVEKIKEQAEKLPDGPTKTDLLEQINQLEAIKSGSSTALSGLNTAGKSLEVAMQESQKTVAELAECMDDTTKALEASKKSIASTRDKLREALDSENLDLIKKILSENNDDLSSFLASPVSLDTHKVYPVENYGSAMAPFYSSLAIWVGGTILASMLHVGLTEERRRKMNNLKYHQEYIGRSVLFICIGLLQALITCCGDLWFLGIQCKHPLLFVLTGLLSSFVFINIAYMLTASFGDVGKAICVILLVIQVAGSGGTFPIEMEPKVFRIMYPFLPFAHSLTAMRESIAGCYGSTYIKEMLILLIYLAISLMIGLFLRKPIIKLNRSFKEKLEDTKTMG